MSLYMFIYVYIRLFVFGKIKKMIDFYCLGY
nr:MAG TPA: hypothetical protein [Caudoviricetes sp.]